MCFNEDETSDIVYDDVSGVLTALPEAILVKYSLDGEDAKILCRSKEYNGSLCNAVLCQ
jgi:hypothetical protein